MSSASSGVDLAALARPANDLPPPRRHWLRVVVPLAIILVFVAILLTTVTDLFQGSVEVTVVRPKVAAGTANDVIARASVVLQAAGWVEPDPFPILVSALTSGVVRELLVREGDHVNLGDPLARLFDEEASLADEAAGAAVDKTRAELDRAQVEEEIANAAFDLALTVHEAAQVAEAELEAKVAEAELREAASKRIEAQVTIAEEELAVQRELVNAQAAGPRQVELAAARLEEARATLAGARADAARARAERKVAQARSDRAQVDVEVRHEDRLRLMTARADLALARAMLHQSEVQRSEARLRLERTTVRAPATGVVLERLVAQGAALEANSASVCTLYDPNSLRVRVDVPQADVSKITVGGKAEIHAETRAQKPYSGEVLRIVQRADIQKVTLQVHVRILDADELLRPEMLCQVRFFGSGNSSNAGSNEIERLLAPARLLDGDWVWVIDGGKQSAVRRKVVKGAADGEWVEITSGLNLSDKLIDVGRESLKNGVRVHVTKEN